jgi:hypothetical protein
VLHAGAHDLTVTFTPTDPTVYRPIMASVPITVLAGSQAVTFGWVPIEVFSQPTFSVAPYASASSGLPVTFTAAANPVTRSLRVGALDPGVVSLGARCLTGRTCTTVVRSGPGSHTYLARVTTRSGRTARGTSPAVVVTWTRPTIALVAARCRGGVPCSRTVCRNWR